MNPIIINVITKIFHSKRLKTIIKFKKQKAKIKNSIFGENKSNMY